MERLRVTWRVIALCAVTGAWYAVWLFGMALVFPFKRAAGRWRNLIFRTWARAVAAIAGMKIETRGEPPRPPFFLVANHLSYVDIIVLAARLDCTFIARSDVAHWPIIGLLCRSMGTIFIDRASRSDIPRVIALMEEAIGRGQGVVLFPEGTSSEGAKVLKFNSSLLEPAARAGYPVSYASLSYRTPPGCVPARLSVCWWGDMTFTRHLLDLLRVPEFTATLIFGAQTIQDGDRKALARRLWQAVDEQFIPVVTAEEQCSVTVY